MPFEVKNFGLKSRGQNVEVKKSGSKHRGQIIYRIFRGDAEHTWHWSKPAIKCLLVDNHANSFPNATRTSIRYQESDLEWWYRRSEFGKY